MKKFTGIILTVLLCMISFCGCESKEERDVKYAREQADMAQKQYEKVKQQKNDVKDALEKYNKYN